ncbi:hypothetical protein Ancab_033903 [Ancistrocladus abbreviatus]
MKRLIPPTRKKLLSALDNISGFIPEALLKCLPAEALYGERSILLWELDQHELAISLCVRKTSQKLAVIPMNKVAGVWLFLLRKRNAPLADFVQDENSDIVAHEGVKKVMVEIDNEDGHYMMYDNSVKSDLNSDDIVIRDFRVLEVKKSGSEDVSHSSEPSKVRLMDPDTGKGGSEKKKSRKNLILDNMKDGNVCWRVFFVVGHTPFEANFNIFSPPSDAVQSCCPIARVLY